MDKNLKKKLIEEMERKKELVAERRFSAEDFTREIALLLSYHFGDYFIGDCCFDGEMIKCTFKNGQQFTVVAKEL